MKIIIDRVDANLRQSALNVANRYLEDKYNETREPGLYHCAIYEVGGKMLGVYHTKAGNITVRQGN